MYRDNVYDPGGIESLRGELRRRDQTIHDLQESAKRHHAAMEGLRQRACGFRDEVERLKTELEIIRTNSKK